MCERCGGTDGMKQIANHVVDLHAWNPRIAARFAEVDIVALKKVPAAFFPHSGLPIDLHLTPRRHNNAVPKMPG